MIKTKTLKPNDCISYGHVGSAMNDLGYRDAGTVVFSERFKQVSKPVYEKDGQFFYIVSWYHFNTTIYEIKLKNVQTLTSCDLYVD